MDTKTIISNTLAGILIAVMNLTVAISVAALMFAGLPPEFLAPGIVVLLIGTVVVGLGGTLFSDYQGVICAPRSGLAPVFAAIVAGLYSLMSDAGASVILPTLLMGIMVTSAVTGLFLILLGQLKLGNLVRYIPYPVMGGFFAGIGYIFIRGGLTVAMGNTPGLNTLTDSHLIALGLPAIVFALVLYVVQNRIDHWSSFPLLLVGAFAVFYGAFFAGDMSLASATADGWLPTIGSTPGILFPVVSLEDLGTVNWAAIVSQAGGIAVVALLSAIILLLDTSGIEIITKRELSPDRELKVMGLTNIASGILGGYPGVHVASDTAFTTKLGGDSRLMGFVYAGVVVLTILAGTDFIGKVPTFILGGLLVYVGLDFLIDWAWKARKELPLSDYCIVLAILAVIAFVNILEGVAFGFAIAIVLFVISYSRLSVTKNDATGRDHASHVDRDLNTRELLNREGERILILYLQGFIFFGTSDKLMTEIRERLEKPANRQPDFLVLDFHHVSQLDTSAVKAFTKLEQMSDRFGFHIVITGIDKTAMDRLRHVIDIDTTGPWQRLSFEQLDEGVAWCEEQILHSLALDKSAISGSLTRLLGTILGDEAVAEELAPYFQQVHMHKGDTLFSQGEPGDSLFLVDTGSVAVVMDIKGTQRILRRDQTGAILGEMAMYTGEPRSASVIIEEEAVLFQLRVSDMNTMQANHPVATGKLHSYIVRVLSERLGRANRELQRYL